MEFELNHHTISIVSLSMHLTFGLDEHVIGY